jgi:hypothetical protein
MDLVEFLKSLEPEELRFIASRDYGEDVDTCLASLRSVAGAEGRFQEDQYWHPYEVVELGALGLVPGHQREFVACTLLVIAAVASGFDAYIDLAAKFADRAEDYDKLDPALRESVLAAYASAGSNNSFKPTPLRGAA